MRFAGSIEPAAFLISQIERIRTRMKKHMKKRWIPFLAMIVYITSVLASPTYAEENTSQAASSDPLGFSYKVIQPENQRNTEVGYFDLRMTPGQQQVVQIELSNPGEVDLTVDVALNGTKTNGNGVVENGPTTIDNDKSLKYDFAELVTGPESVVVPAGQTVPLELTITMPEATYDGVISGGIQLKKAVDKEARKNQTGVINEYAFLVGMLLTETDTPVEPDLALNSVYVGMNNYRNSVFINFSNIEASYLEGLTLEAQIMMADSDTVLYDT